MSMRTVLFSFYLFLQTEALQGTKRIDPKPFAITASSSLEVYVPAICYDAILTGKCKELSTDLCFCLLQGALEYQGKVKC